MTGRFHTIKMLILTKLIDMFNTIPLKIPARFLKIYMDKVILKFIWKSKGTRLAKTILKKNEVRGFSLPNFKSTALQ